MNLSAFARSALLARLDASALARLAARFDTVEFSPGERVMVEGDTSRDLFFVLDGEARVDRQGLAVGSLARGSHVGELGLVTGRARAATVTALTPLRVARLPYERFVALCVDDPQAGLALLLGLVDVLGGELTAMTDSVGVLIRERSLPRRVEVRVACGGGEHVVRT